MNQALIDNIEKQLLEVHGLDAVDHEKEAVLWFDVNEGEWCVNYFAVDEDGKVWVEPVPSFQFSRISKD